MRFAHDAIDQVMRQIIGYGISLDRQPLASSYVCHSSKQAHHQTNPNPDDAFFEAAHWHTGRFVEPRRALGLSHFSRSFMAVSILSCSTMFDEAVGRAQNSTYSSARKSQSNVVVSGKAWSRPSDPCYRKGATLQPGGQASLRPPST